MFGDWMSWAFCVGDCRGRVPVLFRAIWTENRAAKIVGGAGTHAYYANYYLYYYAVGARNSVNNNKKYYVCIGLVRLVLCILCILLVATLVEYY